MRALKAPETALAVGHALVVLALALAYPASVGDAVRSAFVPLSIALVVGALLLCVPTVRARLEPVSRIRPAIVLPLLVALSAALRIGVAHAAALPRVFGDELVYSSLGKSVGLSGDLLLRGDRELGYGVVYPAFIAPVYALAADGASAFVAIKDLNAIVMSLAAVPAYFLARRVVSARWSLLVALLTVLVPAMNYTALVMTEPLFYPGFVCLALALVLALERPTPTRQVVVLALVLMLGLIRAQAFAFAPAVATAIAIECRRGRGLREFRATWILLGVGAVLGLVAWIGAGLSPFGAYGVLARSYSLLDVVKWAAWNLADLEVAAGVVGLAVLPVAAALLLRREASAAERAFGNAAVSLTFWTLASVALLSASPYGLGRLHERNLFYVLPLLAICLAYWLSRGLPRPLVPATIGVATVLVLPLTLPSRFVLADYSIDAPAMLALKRLHEWWSGPSAKTLLIGCAIVGALVFLAARRPLLPLAAVAAAFLGVAAATDWQSPLTPAQVERFAWVDDALPSGGRATLVHVDLPKDVCATVRDDGLQRKLEIWTEFFNARVGHVASVFAQIHDDGLRSKKLTIAADGSLRADASTIRADYVVVDSRIGVDGTPIATLDGRVFGGTGYEALTLWRTDGQLRLAQPARLRGDALRALTCTRPFS